MMIGPAPMMRMLLRSERFGMVLSWSCTGRALQPRRAVASLAPNPRNRAPAPEVATLAGLYAAHGTDYELSVDVRSPGVAPAVIEKDGKLFFAQPFSSVLA